MLASYTDILRIPGALRFSIAGAVLRMPMSLVGISTILMVKAVYGNYTLAGAVSATGIIAVSIGAPLLARLVDQHGQRKVMVPALAISAAALIALAVAGATHAPAWVLFVAAAIQGATGGSPGALVRSRWSKVVHDGRQLTSAYSLEAAIDEFIFIVGPILATLTATAIHPAAGLVIAIVAVTTGTVAFFTQTATEPAPVHKEAGEKRPTVLLNPVVIVLALTFIGAGSLFGANDVSVVAFTEEHGAPAMAGILLAFFAAGSLTAALIYGARQWSQPLWKLFAIGIIALAVGVSTFLLAHSLLALGIIMWITGLAIAPTMTNVNTIISKVVPANQLTEGLTWMSTALNIGVSVGSAIGGRAIDMGGAHGGFSVAVVAAWIMVALMLIGLPRLRRATTAAAERPLLPTDDAESQDSDPEA